MPPSRRLELIASGDTAELWIYDEIGDDGWGGGVSAKSIVEKIDAMSGVSTIRVFINSPGGSVFDAVSIYNVLARHKAAVEVYIDGMALSAASVLAMAGDRIVIAENALMMIHDPMGLSMGNADDMRTLADLLDKVAETIVATYANRTGQSDAQIREWMKDETWFNANEATDYGFADEVVSAKKVAAFGDLSKFRNAPDTLKARIRETNGMPGNSEATGPTKGGDGMSDTKVTKGDPVTAFAAEHPEAVDKWKAEGAAEAIEQERVRFGALLKEFADRPQFVCDQFMLGNDVAKAKAAFADELLKESKANADQIAELKAENAKLAQKLAAQETGHPGVSFTPASDKGGEAKLSVDELAEKHWNEKHPDCAGFADVNGYRRFLAEEFRLAEEKRLAAAKSAING